MADALSCRATLNAAGDSGRWQSSARVLSWCYSIFSPKTVVEWNKIMVLTLPGNSQGNLKHTLIFEAQYQNSYVTCWSCSLKVRVSSNLWPRRRVTSFLENWATHGLQKARAWRGDIIDKASDIQRQSSVPNTPHQWENCDQNLSWSCSTFAQCMLPLVLFWMVLHHTDFGWLTREKWRDLEGFVRVV